jgi:hypothetical protein
MYYKYGMGFIVNPYIFASGAALLLDTYTAEAAYSVRLLRTAYSGALVRIRRDSDNAEKDFYPDGSNVLSMSSEDGAGTSLSTWISTDSGYITVWYDQAGSNNVIQATAGSQPRIINAGSLDVKNSIAAPYFNLDSLAGSAVSGLASANNNTVSVVANHDNALGFGIPLNTNGTNTTNMYRIFVDRRTQQRGLQINNGSTNYFANISTQRDVSDPRLLIIICDSSRNMSTFDNGATGGTATYTGSYTNADLTLGSGGNSLVGNIQEIIIWSSDQSANRTAIETDINGYYSIY